MRFAPSLLALCCYVAAALPAPAQLPAQAPTAAPAETAAPAPLAQVLQGPLSALNQALPSARPDKWKLPNELRRRNSDNLVSIQTDINTTLPGLLSAADAAPSALPPTLAVTRNLDALYDVVLRVTAAAEIGAPEREAGSLSSALSSLNTARQRVDERLRTLATAQQQQLTTLQADLARTSAALTAANSSLQSQKAAAKPATHTRTPRKKPATPSASAQQ